MSRPDRRPSKPSPSPEAIRRGRARPTVSRARSLSLVLWGALLAAGGFLAWRSVPDGTTGLPAAWTGRATSADVAGPRMLSGIQDAAGGGQPLLRMEWPEVAGAEEYRILFRVDGQAVARPLPTGSPVFLYDLESNVLGLPDRFDWSVSAVMRDGREIVSPWQQHPTP
ncbi:hypothetical protein K8I85_01075 [bacterium]|nr:hypothetical protein [bacterium]